ncbi:putative FHA domain containing protein [Verrucomicrobia bacterium]|nr:putative FHA domain containing protein [Verrucomicrobiota bacterium]
MNTHRLVVNPGSPAAWEIQLRQGVNRLGRGFASDFKIEEPSVSGSHCEIMISNGTAIIRDLGSTNGTYINRAPIKEAALKPGQTIHLGGVEMIYQMDAPGAAETVAPAARLAYQAAPAPRPVAAPRATPPPIPPPTVQVAPPVAPPVGAPAGTSKNCKFHPRTAGRFFCNHCQLHFCELCVTSRQVAGAAKKFCRQCGQEVVPVQVKIQRPAGEKGFFARLPGAFIYPFRGAGPLVLIVATLIFSALGRQGIFNLLLTMAALGYLFSYMQSIIHCTAAGDDEMASLPGMDGLFGAFLTLAGTVIISFGIPIGLGVAKVFFDVEDIPSSAIKATISLGCLYFPMAFLAVAMKDTALAANPLVVVPAMLKVPLEYLVTAILLTGVFGLRLLGNLMSSAAMAQGFTTRDMSVLFTSFGIRAFWAFASVYLLTIGMRILGLLYLTKKEKFGWFSR